MRALFGPQIQSQLQARLTAVALLELFMDAPVVTSKIVAAFRHVTTGQVVYIPFESTACNLCNKPDRQKYFRLVEKCDYCWAEDMISYHSIQCSPQSIF